MELGPTQRLNVGGESEGGDCMTDALLIVDLVNDFVTGKLPCERASRIIPNVKRLADGARKAGIPVIYSNDAHLPTDFELKIWGEHSMKGTKGAEIIPELASEKGDYVTEKRTYSAFFETPVDTILRAHDVKNVILTGLHTNICDRHTTADAFFRGYSPVIPEDGVEALTEEDHKSGLEYLKTIYAAKIIDVDGVLKTWK